MVKETNNCMHWLVLTHKTPTPTPTPTHTHIHKHTHTHTHTHTHAHTHTHTHTHTLYIDPLCKIPSKLPTVQTSYTVPNVTMMINDVITKWRPIAIR